MVSKLDVWVPPKLSEKKNWLTELLLVFFCYQDKKWTIFKSNSDWWWKVGTIQ
jgi:hypothetical protein